MHDTSSRDITTEAQDGLNAVEAALDRLLLTCWSDTPSDHPCPLNDWVEYYQAARFDASDGSHAFVLENEVDPDTSNGTVRATLRRVGEEDTVWTLTFRDECLVAVGGSESLDIADVAWQYNRLGAEGAASAKAIGRPPEWHEAREQAEWVRYKVESIGTDLLAREVQRRIVQEGQNLRLGC
jgi:hypothetical protein